MWLPWDLVLGISPLCGFYPVPFAVINYKPEHSSFSESWESQQIIKPKGGLGEPQTFSGYQR